MDETHAFEYRKGFGNDLNVKKVSFSAAAKAADRETVVFAGIVYASCEDRDRINAAVTQDLRLADMQAEDLPFDC